VPTSSSPSWGAPAPATGMLPRHHSESDASAPVRPIPFPRQQSLASPSPSASPSPEPLRSSTPPVGGAQGVGGSRGRTESSSNEVASQGHTPTKAAEPGRKRDLTGGGSIFSGTKFARKVKLSSFGTTSLSPRPSIDLSAAPPPTSPSASSLDVHTRKFSSDSLPGPMSKQAQMLGMGYTPDGATNGNGMGLAEDWYGWGDRVEVPHATMSPTSPRNLKGLEVIAPWDLTDDVVSSSHELREPGADERYQVVTKAAESPVGSLRKGKEKVPAGRGSEGSVKEKKRGGFMSLLKRKTSKTDLNDGEQLVPPISRSRTHKTAPGQSQESMTSYAEYRSPTPPPSFDRLALPAKLKARGDTADVLLPGPPKSSGGTFTKRPKNSKPLLSTPPAPLQKSVFTVDPAILLDTNFDSMEGIITKAAMDAVPPVQRSPVFDADRVDAERAAERNGSVATVLRTGPLNGSSIDGGRRFLTTRRTSSVSVVRGMLEADAPMFAQRTRESSSVSTSVGIGNGSGLGLSGAFWSEGGTPIRTTEPISPSDTRTPQDYPVDPASNGVLGPPLHLGADGANWTAPESWAVKPLSGMNAVPDSSDDESEQAVEDEEEDEGGEEGEGVDEIVPRALSGKEVAVLGTEPESPAAMIGRLAAQARAAPKHGRPGTADRAVQKNVSSARLISSACTDDARSQFMVRVFRPDSTFTTLPVPLAVTAAELLLSLGRKHQIHAKAGYALYLQEKGFGTSLSR
jgi:adenylate cyclase